MFTSSFFIAATVTLIAFLLIIRANRAYNAELARLNADEAKTFYKLIRQKSRVEMPSMFSDLAAKADRAIRTYIFGLLATSASIAYFFIAGPRP
jgi:hypothetical protein